MQLTIAGGLKISLRQAELIWNTSFEIAMKRFDFELYLCFPEGFFCLDTQETLFQCRV